MENFLKRLRAEKDELIEKINKLNSFIGENEEFSSMSSEPKNLLVIQLGAMQTYLSVLLARIEYYDE